MPLTDKITTVDELLAVDEIKDSLFLRECEMLYGPLDENTLWKFRERLRELLEYKKVNVQRFQSKPFHFVHINKSDPNVIAFTSDEKAAKQDKRTFIKPGKYLAKFTELSNEEIKQVVTDYKIKYVPPEVQWATTAEKIIDVYERGPSSCMMGKEWSHTQHPVQVYENPDLKVAYLPKIGGGYTSRAVVRTDRTPPQYIRIYGDVPLMKKAFDALGITESSDGLKGIKFDVKWTTPQQTRFYFPYIDGAHKYVFLTDDETKAEVCNNMNPNRYGTEVTNGSIQMRDICNCNDCGHEIRISRSRNILNEGHFCEECFAKKQPDLVPVFKKVNREIKELAARENSLKARTDLYFFIESENKWYHSSCADDKGYGICSETRTLAPKEELVLDVFNNAYCIKDQVLPVEIRKDNIEFFYPYVDGCFTMPFDAERQIFLNPDISKNNGKPTFYNYAQSILLQFKEFAKEINQHFDVYDAIEENMPGHNAAFKRILAEALYRANNYEYIVYP